MNKTFEDSPFEFHHDSQGRLVSIPSFAELEGYLALDRKKGNFVQVRLARGASREKRELLETLWRQMELSPAVSRISPEVLYSGEEKEIPFYVSSLPPGEPLSSYIRRNGAIPVESAVALVKNWVSSMREREPFDFSLYSVPPESIWIARSSDWQPRIMLGDLLPIRHPAAENVNTLLCLDLLKFLSGNPPFDEDFQNLCDSLQAGPSTLETVRDLLEAYLATHQPDSSYWHDFNQPSPFLDQVVPPEVIIRTGGTDTVEADSVPETLFSTEINAEEKGNGPVIPEPGIKVTKVHRWPGFIRLAGVALLAVTLAAFFMLGLRFFYAEEDQPAVVSKDPGPAASIVQAAQAKAEETQAPDAAAKGQLLSKFTRDDTPVAYEPEPIEITPAKPVQKNPTGMSAFQGLAAEARKNQDIIAAIGYELGALEENPASADSRLRLSADLQAIADRVVLQLTPAETAVIEKAVKLNSKALDILVRHYRSQSQWDKEIEALLELAKLGHPEKLSEAGQRIFENPDSHPADHEAARAYFEEAARQGDRDGQFFAGECFILGRGGEKDFVKGCQYLRQASDRGDVRAMDLLGVCHIRGWGVPRDDARAVSLFQRAIEGNYVPAYYNLGARYAQGQGVERDAKKAADAFEKGSLKGNSNCMLVLGRCFEAGFGRDADFGKAVFWFSKAAAGGNPEAIEWCNKNLIDFTKHLTARN